MLIAVFITEMVILHKYVFIIIIIIIIITLTIHCCGASVASEQQHKQDFKRIYRRHRRGYEFSNSSLFTRMHCILPESIDSTATVLDRKVKKIIILNCKFEFRPNSKQLLMFHQGPNK